MPQHANSLNETALGWVRQDLDKLLEKQRLQIEHLASNPMAGDASLLECAATAEQLQLTFNTLQLDGLKQVMSEIVQLCHLIREGEVGDREAGATAMLDAMVVLPAYLDRMQAGHHDMPVLLLPLINQLREASGTDVLTEGTLFTPLLDVELPELDFDRKPGYDEPFDYLANRMHRQFENALNNWLQDQQEVGGMSPLQGVCETMRHRIKRYPLKRMFWVAAEVIDAFMEGFVENDAQFRRAMARTQLLLKTLAEGGEDAVEEDTINSLTQGLLYHVAHAKDGCSGMELVKERFELERLLPDRDALMRARGTLAGRDRDMYKSLSTAVQDELAMVKDSLDLELRTGQVDPDNRAQCVEALRGLVDTLSMLGLSTPAAAISDVVAEFEGNAEAERSEREAHLGQLAEQLLMVESALVEQMETLGEPIAEAPGENFIDLSYFELKRIRSRLLDEAVVSVHITQEAIRRKLAGERDCDPQESLRHISGALQLIDELGLAGLAERLAVQIEDKLSKAWSEAALEDAQMDALADATAALEMHLAASRDLQADGSRFVGILTDRLEYLEASAAPETPASIVVEQPEESTAAEAEPQTPTASADTEAPKPAGTDAVADALPDLIDPELRDIFLEEYEAVLESLQLAIPVWMNKLDDVSSLTDIRRAFHTLKGSGRMVGADELGDFSWQIEDMLNGLLEGQVENFADIAVMIRLAQASLPALRQRLLHQASGLNRHVILLIGQQAQGLGQGREADWDTLRDLLPVYLAGMLPGGLIVPEDEPAAADDGDEMKALLIAELQTNLEPVQALLEAISNDRSTQADQDQLRALHTIAGALAMQPDNGDADIARALEGVIQAQANSGARFSNEAMWTLVSASGHIQARLDRLRGLGDDTPPEDQEELLRHLDVLTEEMRHGGPAQAELETDAGEPIGEIDQDDQVTSAEFDPGKSVFAQPDPEQESSLETADEAEPEPTLETETEIPELATDSELDVDQELLPIFLEEAKDVLERSDSLLNKWRDDTSELDYVLNLQREIHTFKGGARMAGLEMLGQYSHAMESLLERIAGRLMPPSVAAVKLLEDACDRLQGWVDQVASGVAPETRKAQTLLENQIDALDSAPGDAAMPGKPAAPPKTLQEIPETQVQAPEPHEELGGPAQVKVGADLLDSLVNASGEVSIFRSRLEQQVGGLRSNLGEFDETIARLREQFRKLDIEIETQVRSNYPETTKSNGEEFDPLELDEFSTLHQLSRSLSESVADLLNLQEMLEENTRKAEQLLLQQSRVSSELQEGLMKTRMVPFGSVAPRLRRLVRTSSKETNKNARLQLQMVGSSDELDRNVLETITTPLEHMIRNAVAHGIELPDVRQQAGKDPQGEIAITVESEATEFVIRIEDDGAGINTDAIHKRAVERGLLDKADTPSRQQLYDFMLDSGFSTSSKVTGLAGRGVGMDVVSSEIKQIGGSLEIDSTPGEGSRFTVRIPFTLAVMQAIGLMAGDQRYLLPLSSVVGVARMLPKDYLALTAGENPVHSFAGKDYPVFDLERLLGERPRPLNRDNVTLLIISAGDQKAAFRVPEMLPHREVVIKPVGPQVSCVPGILGGSISAKGEVVVILDPGPLIRHALIHGAPELVETEAEKTRSNQKLVMVVDDSITMRKVTSRVLEDRDFEVITARDGVDATEKLQERVPDIMLLDIEMPRMDGYELTEYIRDDARLRHVPIMMITSRAGQKHRDRAELAGANAYMTKPYSESELLDNVNRLLYEELD